MRERTLNSIYDKVIWLLISLLPLILLAIYSFHHEIIIADFLANTGLEVLSSSPIYSMYFSLFADGGLIPIFANNSLVITYFTYLTSVYLLHLVFDVVVFIPRLFHDLLSKTYHGGDLL